MLRYCALALTTLEGDPRELSRRIDDLIEDLRRARPWYKRSSVGTLLAAMLLRHGESAAQFFAAVDSAAPLFRKHWRFEGSTYQALAVGVLCQQSDDRRVSAAQVARLAQIWNEIKVAHPWLTQKSDWPMCALLSSDSATPLQISARIEALYADLNKRGFSRGDELQAAAQILYFHLGDPAACCLRFEELFNAFKRSGLWMGSFDYDEIALLCFAPQNPAVVLECVERHRATISGLPQRPDKQLSFTLACGTALLELAREAPKLQLLSEAQVLLAIQAILRAQQAAAAAAAG
jgi:hypothetical protein